jgi:hypothetical protein
MTTLPTRPLGRSGHDASVLGYGAMELRGAHADVIGASAAAAITARLEEVAARAGDAATVPS